MTPLDAAQAIIDARARATQGEWWVSSRHDGHMLNNHNILNRDTQGDVCVLLQANHYMPNVEADLHLTALTANHAAAVAQAYLDAKDRIGILNEKLNWQNHRNSGWPTRGGYEFYAAEGWNAAPEMSHIMRERYDPDDDRVRVRRVAEDDQLLADLAAEKKRVAELVELVKEIHSRSGTTDVNELYRWIPKQLARIMGKEAHDDA